MNPSRNDMFTFHLNDNTSISLENRCINNYIYDCRFTFYLKSNCIVNFLKSSWSRADRFMKIFQYSDTIFNISGTTFPASLYQEIPCCSTFYHDHSTLSCLVSFEIKGSLVFKPKITTTKISFVTILFSDTIMNLNSSLSYEFGTLALINSSINFQESNVKVKGNLELEKILF